MESPKNLVVYSYFKGMGDLLWAAPVIRSELDAGAQVHLLVFHSKAISDFCDLIDFGPRRKSLYIHFVPQSRSELRPFIAKMRQLDPRLIWISPHAPIADSNWRVSFGLFLLKLFFWRRAQLVGASSERLSWLFSRALQVDRKLPLRLREWSAYRQFRGSEVADQPSLPHFLPEIMQRRERASTYDLIIHPGANAVNRVWPADKYPSVIAALPSEWRIAVVGLSADVKAVKDQLEVANVASREMDYLTGSLYESLIHLSSARLLLVMDSGNAHFAEVLGVPTLAVFGKENPATIIGESRTVQAVYEKSVACQPCGRSVCAQPQVYCLTNLDPLAVAELLRLRSTLLA